MKQKMIMMVGYPGSGKSTYARTLVRHGYRIINQDAEGGAGSLNREKCEALMEHYLMSGQNVVIDRCNINKKQRSTFIILARNINPELIIECIVMITDPKKCASRIHTRANHKTLTNKNPTKIIKAIGLFHKTRQFPHEREGVDKITRIYAK
ncbi:hypothetical protein LCGC14_0195140 [marine sediment metagenome]|uniref:Uncharacterized protein n=1 Tax=marine sediment metagenome TaxID=412755 RepID=A0A0F9X4A8_9ZZZZ